MNLKEFLEINEQQVQTTAQTAQTQPTAKPTQQPQAQPQKQQAGTPVMNSLQALSIIKNYIQKDPKLVSALSVVSNDPKYSKAIQTLGLIIPKKG